MCFRGLLQLDASHITTAAVLVSPLFRLTMVFRISAKFEMWLLRQYKREYVLDVLSANQLFPLYTIEYCSSRGFHVY